MKKLEEDPAVLFLWSWLVLYLRAKNHPIDSQSHYLLLSCYITGKHRYLFCSVFLGLGWWTGDRWLWMSADSENVYPLFLFFSTGIGSCVDSLSYNQGATFSTKDKDSDLSPGGNCAVVHQGAWWYKSCTRTNLNGLYNPTGYDFTGIYWYQTIHNQIVHLKRVEMMLELVE